MRLFAAQIIACLILSGCGTASAATIDPADDVHCSVVAFYFHGLAKHHGFPDDQQRAAKGIHEWYASKMRQVAVGRWGGMAGFEKEVAPLLETIKSDPLAMRDEMTTCTERAGRDPAFNRFARTQGF